MNPLDILLIVVLLYCLVMGFFRGFIREVAAILGVMAGFYAGYSLYPFLAAHLTRWMASPAYRNIFSFLLIFSAVFIIIGLIAVVIQYLLKNSSLNWMDRISGGGIGAVKGMLIISVMLLILMTFLPANVPIIRDSLLAPTVVRISEQMIKIASKDMKQRFEVKVEPFKKSRESSIKHGT